MHGIEVMINDINHFLVDTLNLWKKLVSNKKKALSIYDCIKNFLREEIVELKCDSFSKHVEYNMKTEWVKLPKFLIIQLKRFSYDITETKILTLIGFPPDNLQLNTIIPFLTSAFINKLHFALSKYLSFQLIYIILGSSNLNLAYSDLNLKSDSKISYTLIDLKVKYTTL